MKTPNKLYIIKDKKGKLSKAYKRLHDAKNKMKSENDILITYSLESSQTLKSIKRDVRLSHILGKEDGFPNSLEKDVISLLRKYLSNKSNKINNIISSKELNRFVVNNKRSLMVHMTSVDEFTTILKFHNFRDCGVGISDKNKVMFNMAKEFNKQ